MDFSYSYRDAMSRYLLANTAEKSQYSNLGTTAYKTALICDAKSNEVCEVPVYIYNNISYYLRNNQEGVELVVPLNADEYHHKAVAGAETAIKYLSRNSMGLYTVKFNKNNEVYYGNNSLILDSQFRPLLFTTYDVVYTEELGMTPIKANVYLHPRVFTNDLGPLEKSLAKKGVAFYLEMNNFREIPIEVHINDCKKFFKTPSKPDLNKVDENTFNDVAKEYIDELLSQVIDDFRR